MSRNILGQEVDVRLRSVRAVLLCGLPGSGKTTIARVLVDRFGFEHLSSDDIRLSGFPMLQHGGPRSEARDEALLSLARDWTYLEMARRAWSRLLGGGKVALDATNTDPDRRDRLASVVTRALGDPGLAIWLVCRTPKEVIASRVESGDPDWRPLYEKFESRIARGDASLPHGSHYQGLSVVDLAEC